jgi:hypothetical protein
MSRHYFRAYGALTLLFGPAIFADAVFSQTQTQVLRGLFLVAVCELVGFGLASLRKWAALYFSIPLFWFGIRLVGVSIYEISFPGNLLAMLYSLFFTLPLFITIRYWKELTWGRRFF